jgi:hypothetical protein
MKKLMPLEFFSDYLDALSNIREEEERARRQMVWILTITTVIAVLAITFAFPYFEE